jgi:hypothetical protein
MQHYDTIDRRSVLELGHILGVCAFSSLLRLGSFLVFKGVTAGHTDVIIRSAGIEALILVGQVNI